MHYGYLEERKWNFVKKTRGNEKYSSKKYKQTMLIPTL
jgi:hypothetical protein